LVIFGIVNGYMATSISSVALETDYKIYGTRVGEYSNVRGPRIDRVRYLISTIAKKMNYGSRFGVLSMLVLYLIKVARYSFLTARKLLS